MANYTVCYYLFIKHIMQHKNIKPRANKYKETIQSSKIKAVPLTKADNCQLITDNMQYFQMSN